MRVTATLPKPAAPKSCRRSTTSTLRPSRLPFAGPSRHRATRRARRTDGLRLREREARAVIETKRTRRARARRPQDSIASAISIEKITPFEIKELGRATSGSRRSRAVVGFAIRSRIEIASKLEKLLLLPRTYRMPNLLIVGENNNGKTALVRRFIRGHPPQESAGDLPSSIAVVAIEAPPVPDERRLY
jgi:hypothetical protein